MCVLIESSVLCTAFTGLAGVTWKIVSNSTQTLCTLNRSMSTISKIQSKGKSSLKLWDSEMVGYVLWNEKPQTFSGVKKKLAAWTLLIFINTVAKF